MAAKEDSGTGPAGYGTEGPAPKRANGELTSLERAVRRNPGSVEAEAALDEIVRILSRDLRAGGHGGGLTSDAAPPLPAPWPKPASPGGRSRLALATPEWLALVPPSQRDQIVFDVVSVLEALVADLQSGAAGGGLEPVDVTRFTQRVIQEFRRNGFRAALYRVYCEAPRRQRSLILEEFGNALAHVDGQAAVRGYWLSYASSPTVPKARKLAQKMFKAGNVSSAGSLIQLADGRNDSNFVGELRLAAHLLADLPAIPPRRPHGGAGADGLAYVASSSLSYQLVGYTVRTHNILGALQQAGLGVHCYVRPGYPWDRPRVGPPRHDASATELIETVPYSYSRIEDVSHEPERFVERMSRALEAEFRKRMPRVVQAASNHRNALPALIAARRVGAPFVYEIRGLWELTAASRIPSWELTERFVLERQLELLIASEADQVLCITQGVADEIAAGGVPAEQISLLPNAVDPTRFVPAEKDMQLADRLDLRQFDFVLAYCGSVTNYEGLDDLIQAIAILARDSIRAGLVIVGDGPYRPTLQRLAVEQGVEGSIRFLNPVDPGKVAQYWALADIVALPRKPFRVCEIVSPLKPFEAMAMALPVVLSDLPVAREIVRHGETGILCRPADPADLAQSLAALARDPAYRKRLGATARAWVSANRSWARNADRLIELYDQLAPRFRPGAYNLN